MTTKYFGTIICAALVLLIVAVWVIGILAKKEQEHDFWQVQTFSALGTLIVLGAAAMGV